MTQKTIGPTFGAELAAAGLSGLRFAWDADGGLCFSDTMTTEQITRVEAVLAVHDPESLDAKRAARIDQLTVLCSAAVVGGYKSTALGGAHAYPSGITDQINMMGSVTASLLPDLAADWATPFWCADSAGAWDFRMHNAEQIQRAGSDGKAHIVTCQSTLAQLSADVMAATTDAAIDTVIWPAE
jgi:hypothetical protein